MQVNSWKDETAKEIIWELEDLLSDNDIKLNNRDPNENKFKDENSYINIKDFNELKEKIIKQLDYFEEYIESRFQEVA